MPVTGARPGRRTSTWPAPSPAHDLDWTSPRGNRGPHRLAHSAWKEPTDEAGTPSSEGDTANKTDRYLTAQSVYNADWSAGMVKVAWSRSPYAHARIAESRRQCAASARDGRRCVTRPSRPVSDPTPFLLDPAGLVESTPTSAALR